MKASELNKKMTNYNQVPESVGWNPDKGWESYSDRNYVVSRKSLVMQLVTVAASVLLILGVFHFLQRSGEKWYRNSSAELYEFQINKNIKLTLNKDSELAYVKKQNLIKFSGQAYVEINAEKDFVFVIGKDSVLVKQAVFCVLYNPETNQQTIQVEQGEIVYKTNAYALNIEAGEELNNAGGKVVFVEAIQNANYKAWISKQFVFDELPLFLVMEQLNQVFPYKYDYIDNDTKYCIINGSFSGESMFEIVKQIPFEKHIEFKMNKNQLTIAGPGC